MCTGSKFCEEMANNANTPKIKYLNQVKLLELGVLFILVMIL